MSSEHDPRVSLSTRKIFGRVLSAVAALLLAACAPAGPGKPAEKGVDRAQPQPETRPIAQPEPPPPQPEEKPIAQPDPEVKPEPLPPPPT